MIKKIAQYIFLFFLIAGTSGVCVYILLTFILQGQKTIMVPNLIGKDIIYTLETLEHLGLNIKLKGTEFHDKIPEHSVIHQSPDPGIELKKGRDVRVVISKGPKIIQMPDFVKLSIDHAKILIEKNELCFKGFSRMYSADVDKDHVIAQSPLKNNPLMRNDCIQLLISLGARPQFILMPDLVDTSLNEAISILEANKLKAGNIKFQQKKNKILNTVIQQAPLSGYRVETGTSINLIINRKKSAKNPNDIIKSSGCYLFKYRLENGFLNRHIRIQINGQNGSVDYFDKYVKPGQEVWTLIPKNNNVTILLYENGKLKETKLVD